MNSYVHNKLAYGRNVTISKILCGMFFVQVMSGCTTTLSSTRMPAATAPPPSGLVYKLPAKRFSLAVSYEIKSCDDSDPNNPIISAIVSPTLTSTIEGDDTATFVLDYESLKAATKVQKLNVTMSSNGLLSGLNSDNQDKTADVITNVASSIFAAGRAIALSPIQARMKAANVIPCKHYLESRLTNKANLENNLPGYKKDDKERNDIETTITEIKTTIAELKGEINFYTDVDTAATKTLLSNAQKELNKNEALLASKQSDLDRKGISKTEEAKTKIDKLRSELTFITKASFVPRINNTSTPPINDTSKEIELLDTEAKKTIFGDPGASCVSCPKVKLSIQPSQITGNGNSMVNPANGFGIAYRIPAMTTASVIVELPERSYEALQLNTPVPQLGSIASLNLKNKPFEDTNLTVAFDENGGVSKLDFSSTAQALQASAAAKSTMDGYLDFVKQRQNDRTTAIKQNLDLQKTQADTAAAVAADSYAIAKGAADTAHSVASDRVQTLKSLMDLQALQSGTASSNVQTISNLQQQNQLLDLQIQNAQKQQQLKDILNGTAK